MISELIERIRSFIRDRLDRKKDVSRAKARDEALIGFIAPAGGISFRDDRLIKTGEGYLACVHIIDYPSTVDRFWGVPLINMGTGIVTMDIHAPDQKVVMENIDRSFRNQSGLIENERDISERTDIDFTRSQYEELLRELTGKEDAIRYVHTRMYLSSPTAEKLDEKTASVRERLRSSGYRGYVLVAETKQEFRAMTEAYSEQYMDLGEELRRHGQPVAVSALADSYPFHFTSLMDRSGTYLGATELGGNVIFDMFEKSDTRLSYDMCLFGTKGSGKSTTIKLLVGNAVSRGDIVYGIDCSGEYERFVKHLGGTYLKMDGSEGTVNPLEILSTAESETVSYARHLSNIRTFYEYLRGKGSSGTDTAETMLVEELAGKLYEKMGLPKDGRYTSLPPEEYPVLSDLLDTALDELYSDREKQTIREGITGKTAERLENIVMTLRSTVKNYPGIFDRRTSVEGIADRKLVYFDLSNVMRMNTSVSGAVLFLVLMLSRDRTLRTGRRMLEEYNLGRIRLRDVTHSLIVIDEAHNIINTEQRGALREIHRMIMENRKFFTSLIYASPSMSSFIKNDIQGEERDLIVSVFNETQYRFLLRQPDGAVPLIRQVFGRSIPESYLDSLPKFSRGEALLSIAGEGTLRMRIHLSEKSERLFGGGA